MGRAAGTSTPIRLLGGLGILLLAAGSASGQSKTGTAIAQFMGIEPSSRIVAMGNAGVAVYDGIQSVYYNPAALGAVQQTALEFTHGFWFAGIRYDYAAFAYPAGGWGTFFGSLTALNSGEIDVRTVAKPLGTGERYTVEDVALGIGYGREITGRFGAGVQVNYISETIWHSSLQTLTVSLGSAYRVSESGMTLGASLSNIGTRARYDGRDLAIQYDNDPTRHGDNSTLPGDQFTDEFPVPILFRVGMVFPRRTSPDSKLLFAVDAFHPSDNAEGMNVGWEWSWRDAFAIRAGYQNMFQEDSDVGLTAGFGIQAPFGTHRFQFDYAWANHLFLQETHRLSFILKM
jgi:hypothetical protein